MNSNLFYNYAALLFGLGLAKVTTTAIYNVDSFTGVGYSEGPGILVYVPESGHFVFIAKANQHFNGRKKYMIEGLNDDFMSSHFHCIAALRVEGGGDNEDIKQFDLLNKIDYYLPSPGDKSLTVKFNQLRDTVTITFSDNAGYKAVEEIFSKANVRLYGKWLP